MNGNIPYPRTVFKRCFQSRAIVCGRRKLSRQASGQMQKRIHDLFGKSCILSCCKYQNPKNSSTDLKKAFSFFQKAFPHRVRASVSIGLKRFGITFQGTALIFRKLLRNLDKNLYIMIAAALSAQRRHPFSADRKDIARLSPRRNLQRRFPCHRRDIHGSAECRRREIDRHTAKVHRAEISHARAHG